MLLNILQSTGRQHALCNKDLSTQNVNGAKVGEPDPERVAREWKSLICSDASGLCRQEEKHSPCGDRGKVPCMTRR